MASNMTKRLRRARGLCEQCAQPVEYGAAQCAACVELAEWAAISDRVPCNPTREQCRPLEIIEQERQWMAADYERMRRAWPMPHGRGIY